MSEVGIRTLSQNASALVAHAASGATVTITDKGRPVAQLTAIPRSRLRSLTEAGRARAARLRIEDLPVPPAADVVLADELEAMRAAERQ